jgi:hypothetical protein
VINLKFLITLSSLRETGALPCVWGARRRPENARQRLCRAFFQPRRTTKGTRQFFSRKSLFVVRLPLNARLRIFVVRHDGKKQPRWPLPDSVQHPCETASNTLYRVSVLRRTTNKQKKKKQHREGPAAGWPPPRRSPTHVTTARGARY